MLLKVVLPDLRYWHHLESGIQKSSVPNTDLCLPETLGTQNIKYTDTHAQTYERETEIEIEREQ